MLTVFIAVAAVLGLSLGIVGIALASRPRKSNVKNIKSKEAMDAYKFLYSNFLTRSSFRKVVEQLANLSIYSFMEVRAQAVKYYTQALAMSVSLVVVSILLFQDIIAVLMVCVFAVVIHTTAITKRLEDIHFIVMKQLSAALSSVRENYTRLGNIPDAINDAKKGAFVQKAFDKIYLILTSPDAEEQLEEFYKVVPYHMEQTFAGVCYLLNDIGDEFSPQGESAFKNAITLLKSEADLEIRKITKQRLLFGSIQWMPLIPLPFVGFLEWFFSTQIPATTSIYNGMVGYISRTLIILSGLLGYYVITTINNTATVKHDDRSSLLVTLQDSKFVKPIVKHISPKKLKTKQSIGKLLNGSLSAKDIPYIYTSKLVFGIVGFIITLLLVISFTFIGKEYIYNNTAPTSLLGTSNMTIADHEKLKEIDKDILSRESKPRAKDISDIIKATFPAMSAMDIQDQVDRLSSKFDAYHNARYHWYYIVISFVVALICWFMPEMLIALRRMLIQAETEEDVLQLQTMLSILMFTNLDTLEALWWLGRQSRIHKDALVFAFHEYPSDPEKAISRLKDKSSLPEFQQIAERLMSTISQISLAEAFSDLIAERSHMLRVKEMVQEKVVYSKRNLASPFARAPIILTAVGHVLAPIGILGVSEMMKVFGQLLG